MAVLTDYLSRRGEVLVLVLAVVLSVALMLLSRAEKEAVARLIGDTTLTPVQAALSRGRALTGLRSENDSLRTMLARTSLEVAALREAEREAERLREQLDFRGRTRLQVLGARVIAREAARPGLDWKVDRGARDGVRRNLAVITVDGLLGKVTAVESRSSYVRPLVAPGCRVSARLSRTRTDGILDWSEEHGLLLAFLPLLAEVEVGDEIVTSGLGGVFPLGIPIGSVEHIETVPADGSLRVFVDPAVAFRRLEEVFVVAEEGILFGDEIVDPGFAPTPIDTTATTAAEEAADEESP